MSLENQNNEQEKVYPYTQYKLHNNKLKWFLSTDYDDYKIQLRQMKGIRYNTLKCGSGWLFPHDKENDLKIFCDSLPLLNSAISKEEQLTRMEKNAKPRKKQHKYHRANSDSENDNDVIQYYKKFSKSPVKSTPPLSDHEGESDDSPITTEKYNMLEKQIEELKKQLETIHKN